MWRFLSRDLKPLLTNATPPNHTFFTNMVAKHKKVQKPLPLPGLKLGSLWWLLGALLMWNSIAE